MASLEEICIRGNKSEILSKLNKDNMYDVIQVAHKVGKLKSINIIINKLQDEVKPEFYFNRALIGAGEGKNRKLVKALLLVNNSRNLSYAMAGACKTKSISFVKFLIKLGAYYSHINCNILRLKNYLILRYLLQKQQTQVSSLLHEYCGGTRKYEKNLIEKGLSGTKIPIWYFETSQIEIRIQKPVVLKDLRRELQRYVNYKN